MEFLLTAVFKPVKSNTHNARSRLNGFRPIGGASTGLKAGVNLTVSIRGDSRDSRANKYKYQVACDS
jgi:hypothetical protein